MTIKRRLKALECRTKPKAPPPALTVERRGEWAYIFWGRQLIQVIPAELWDAL